MPTFTICKCRDFPYSIQAIKKIILYSLLLLSAGIVLRQGIRLVQQFQGFLHALVKAVDDLEVFAHVPQVAGDEGFQLGLDEGK